MTEIIIEPGAGCILVIVPDGGWMELDYVSAHSSYDLALAEALKLQKETFCPAVLRDLVGGAA